MDVEDLGDPAPALSGRCTVVCYQTQRLFLFFIVPVHTAMNDLPCLGRGGAPQSTELPPLINEQGCVNSCSFLGSGPNAQRGLAGKCHQCHVGGGLPFRLCRRALRVPNVMPLTAKIGIGCRQVATAPSTALDAGEQRPVCATRCPWALGARVSKVGLGDAFLHKHNQNLKHLPDRFFFWQSLALWPIISLQFASHWLVAAISLARLGVQVQQVWVNLLPAWSLLTLSWLMPLASVAM